MHNMQTYQNPLEHLEKTIDSYIQMYQKIDQAEIPEEAKEGLYALVTQDLYSAVLGKGLNNMMMQYAAQGMMQQMYGKNSTEMHHAQPQKLGGTKPYMTGNAKPYSGQSIDSKIDSAKKASALKQ